MFVSMYSDELFRLFSVLLQFLLKAPSCFIRPVSVFNMAYEINEIKSKHVQFTAQVVVLDCCKYNLCENLFMVHVISFSALGWLFFFFLLFYFIIVHNHRSAVNCSL